MNSDRLRRFFSQQDKGFVIKASEEQIRSLTQDAETGGGGGSKGPFNLLRNPTFSNQYGKLYEVDPSERRELAEIDIAVGFANITKVPSLPLSTHTHRHTHTHGLNSNIILHYSLYGGFLSRL